MNNKSLQRKLALEQICTCLESIYKNGINDHVGAQEAVNCQIVINRIVYDFNHINDLLDSSNT